MALGLLMGLVGLVSSGIGGAIEDKMTANRFHDEDSYYDRHMNLYLRKNGHRAAKCRLIRGGNFTGSVTNAALDDKEGDYILYDIYEKKAVRNYTKEDDYRQEEIWKQKAIREGQDVYFICERHVCKGKYRLIEDTYRYLDINTGDMYAQRRIYDTDKKCCWYYVSLNTGRVVKPISEEYKLKNIDIATLNQYIEKFAQGYENGRLWSYLRQNKCGNINEPFNFRSYMVRLFLMEQKALCEYDENFIARDIESGKWLDI